MFVPSKLLIMLKMCSRFLKGCWILSSIYSTIHVIFFLFYVISYMYRFLSLDQPCISAPTPQFLSLYHLSVMVLDPVTTPGSVCSPTPWPIRKGWCAAALQNGTQAWSQLELLHHSVRDSSSLALSQLHPFLHNPQVLEKEDFPCFKISTPQFTHADNFLVIISTL